MHNCLFIVVQYSFFIVTIQKYLFLEAPFKLSVPIIKDTLLDSFQIRVVYFQPKQDRISIFKNAKYLSATSCIDAKYPFGHFLEKSTIDLPCPSYAHVFQCFKK